MATVNISISIDVADSTVHRLLEELGIEALGPVDVSDDETTDIELLGEMLRADLNARERAVLHRMADRHPEPATHDELLAICGSSPRYGNVMSGLKRRWTSRGGRGTPWREIPRVGYAVDLAFADLVRRQLVPPADSS